MERPFDTTGREPVRYGSLVVWQLTDPAARERSAMAAMEALTRSWERHLEETQCELPAEPAQEAA